MPQSSKLKAKDADATRIALTKATTELDSVKQTAAAQQKKLGEVEPQLATVTRERDQLQGDVTRWKKLATDSPGVVIPFNDKLTEIEKLLGSLDTRNWDATKAAFVKAGTEYRKLEGERAALVAPNQFEAKHPKVKAKDAELAQAADLLTKALAKLDSADKTQHDKLQQQIDSRQKLHDEERGVGVAEQNSELVQLRAAIASLKQQQAKHATGRDRAAGTGKALSLDEVVKLSGVPPVVIASSDGASGAKFTDKGGNNYIRIEPDEFLMGAPNGEAEASDDEKPQHRVRISQPFYFGEYEETQAEFQDVMGFNPSYFSANGGGSSSVKGMDTAKFPVESICWYDVCEFANRKSQKNGLTPCYRLSNVQKDGQHIKSADVTFIPEGTGFRMPKEAEWEYVARAGTTTPFWFGLSNNGEKANVDGNSPYGTTTKGPYLARTTKVGSYAANAFGVYDTVGNVWEPCQDVYDEEAYASRGNGVTNDPLVTSGSGRRVFRGGSYYSVSWYTRSADRSRDTPDNRVQVDGCRLVLSASGVRTRND